jgi:hypothetical protein
LEGLNLEAKFHDVLFVFLFSRRFSLQTKPQNSVYFQWFTLLFRQFFSANYSFFSASITLDAPDLGLGREEFEDLFDVDLHAIRAVAAVAEDGTERLA